MARSVVIIGGGIMGVSTAYYLSRHPNIGDTPIHVLEASEIAAGSSGKGGGFLASDWHGGNTVSLGAESYKLHEQLAQEHDGAANWGFRKLVTVGVSKQSDGLHSSRVPGAEWLSSVDSYNLMGTERTTAQVHPYLFTTTLLRLAQEKGVKVTIASADGLDFEGDTITAVHATEQSGNKLTLPATDVVFCSGPWTSALAKRLLGKRAGAATNVVAKTRSTSIVYRMPTDKPISAHAVFSDLEVPSGSSRPEFYPRPDGTVYICGDHSDPGRPAPLPAMAKDVVPSDYAVKNLQVLARFMSSHFDTATVEVTQACFKPESLTGQPIIGKLGPGLWIAGGHSVWGITQGPGTGKCMAELILDGKATTANIARLAP